MTRDIAIVHLTVWCVYVLECDVNISVADNGRLWGHKRRDNTAVDFQPWNAQFSAMFCCSDAQSIPKTLDHRVRS